MSDAADRPGASRPAPKEETANGPLAAPCRPGSSAAAGAPRAPATIDRLWTPLGHELRTPLHAILGNVELLVDGSAGPLSADARACLGEVQDAGRQLMRQIDLVLLLIQAGATPGPGAEDAVDFLERVHAAQQQLAGPAAVPQGGRLVLKGDPFWLDAWAGALVEAEPGGSGDCVGIERTADPAPHEVGLRIVWSASTSRQPSPVVLMLIDAIVRLHGGRTLPQAGAALCLAWPKSRLVAWQTG